MAISSFDLSSLNGTNGFVINQLGSFPSPTSVSSAGDINGDGIDDIIIGAYNASPDGKDRAGESYVVFGSSSGFSPSLDLSTLNGTNGFVINGIDERDFSGDSVSGAGDINGDGIDDLIIGAIGADPPRKSDAGESYVVFGSSSGFSPSFNLSSLNGTNGFVINGIDNVDFSGDSVSGAGDINGDGIDDIIIGADVADPNGTVLAGESYVVFGSSTVFLPSLDLSSLNGTNGFVINGIDSLDYSGGSVSGAGDINGDGIDDIIIGANRADPNGKSTAGESYVVFGSSSGFLPSLNLSSLNGTNGFVINGIDNGDFSGESVSSAGDINGDGIDDIIIGAAGADPNGISSGESYVVFGSSSGFSPSLNLSTLDGMNGFVINGIDNGDYSGGSVSGAGDINGDGIDDLIIGANRADPNGTFRAGESYVVFGASSGFSPSLNLSTLNGTNGFVINGIDLSDFSGGSVSGAGDINGDGIDDLIIGVGPRLTEISNGDSYVVFGQRSDDISNDRIRGTGSDDLLTGDRLKNTILGLAGNDTLRGRQGDDKLIGSGGNDLLVGGAGSDRLNGGNGFDTLRGGAGEDEFVFQNGRHKADRILDFNATEDVILISKSGFDLDIAKGNLGNGRFTIGSGASDKGDRFIYNDQTGRLIFDANGSEAGGRRTIAFLSNSPDLTAANIQII